MTAKLQKKNILLMIILTFFTFGIYTPVWFLNRKDIFNSMNSDDKISAGPIVFALSLFIISAVLLFPSILFMETEMENIIDAINKILSIIGGVIILLMSFRVRRILEDHYKTELSSIATFFFLILYLQYEINCFIDEEAETKKSGKINNTE